MNTVKNTKYHGERPLFKSHDLQMENIEILDGESALKECQNLTCNQSYFNGKYPFWHVDNALIEDCTFDTNARAAIWYSNKITMKNSTVDCPKMFRITTKITLEKVNFTDAKETLWDCSEISMKD